MRVVGTLETMQRRKVVVVSIESVAVAGRGSVPGRVRDPGRGPCARPGSLGAPRRCSLMLMVASRLPRAELKLRSELNINATLHLLKYADG